MIQPINHCRIIAYSHERKQIYVVGPPGSIFEEPNGIWVCANENKIGDTGTLVRLNQEYHQLAFWCFENDRKLEKVS